MEYALIVIKCRDNFSGNFLKQNMISQQSKVERKYQNKNTALRHYYCIHIRIVFHVQTQQKEIFPWKSSVKWISENQILPWCDNMWARRKFCYAFTLHIILFFILHNSVNET